VNCVSNVNRKASSLSSVDSLVALLSYENGKESGEKSLVEKKRMKLRARIS